MKQQSFWSITNIIVMGLCCILIITYFYPYFIDYIMCHYTNWHNFSNAPSERGTFGDMYGALNSFLSGLAVLGIVLTLYWDKTLKNVELEHHKSEKINQEIDKLIYLRNLLQNSHGFTVDLKNRLISILDSNNQDFSELPAWQIDINFENLKTINKTINQEKYFFAYRNQIGGNNILNTFSACRHIEEFENIQRNRLVSEIEKCHYRKIEANQYAALPPTDENNFILDHLNLKNRELNESILLQLQQSNVQLDSSIQALQNELDNFQRLRVIS